MALSPKSVPAVASATRATSARGRFTGKSLLSVATFALWVSSYLVSQIVPMLSDNAFLIKHFARSSSGSHWRGHNTP